MKRRRAGSSVHLSVGRAALAYAPGELTQQMPPHLNAARRLGAKGTIPRTMKMIFEEDGARKLCRPWITQQQLCPITRMTLKDRLIGVPMLRPSPLGRIQHTLDCCFINQLDLS